MPARRNDKKRGDKSSRGNEMKAAPPATETPSTRRSARTTRDQHAEAGERTAQQYRQIQRQVDQKDEQRKQQKPQGESKQQSKQKPSMQAGARKQPTPPLPEQHQAKPGLESELEPRPRYAAPDYKGSEKLLDRVALITGADSGIGRSVAVLFAREGADVAVVYLSEHSDAEETKRAVEAEGRKCLLIAGDVSDPDFCEDAVERTVKAFGKLNVLVNNAAFQEHVEHFEELTEEHFDRTMKTNVYGYFHMAKAAVPHLSSGDSIINTGSVTGMFGDRTLLDYSATKGAIHALTQSLAQSLAEQGIRVNAVAPGPVWTPLNPADQPPEQVSEFGAQTLMKRPAQPEELAPTYVFLAAPVCSSYITGEIIPVLGGMSTG